MNKNIKDSCFRRKKNNNNDKFNQRRNFKNLKQDYHQKSNKKFLSILIISGLIISGVLIYLLIVNKSLQNKWFNLDNKILKNLNNKDDLINRKYNQDESSFQVMLIKDNLEKEIISIKNTIADKLGKITTKNDENEKLFRDEILLLKKEIKRMDFFLNDVNLEQNCILRALNFIKEADKAFNYWGDKKKSLLLLKKAIAFLNYSKSEKISEVKNKIKSLITFIEDFEIIAKKVILKKINIFAKEINKFDFEKQFITLSKNESNNKEVFDDASSDTFEQKNNALGRIDVFKNHLQKIYEEIKQYVKIRKKDEGKIFSDRLSSIFVKEKILLLLEEMKLSILVEDEILFNDIFSDLEVIFNDFQIMNFPSLSNQFLFIKNIKFHKEFKLFSDIENSLDESLAI